MIVIRILRKFMRLFSIKEKKQLVFIFFIMIIASFMEMCSVTLLLPFMEFIINPETTMQNKYVLYMYNKLGFSNTHIFFVFFAIMFALLFLIKNLFLLFQLKTQNKFVYNNLLIVQKKLLNIYLSSPYEFFLNIKSGEVIRIIQTDTVSAFGILTHLLTVISECFVTVTLLIALIILNPFGTLFMGLVLLLVVFLIQKIMRPFLKKAGEMHQLSLAEMNKWILESIQGIKDVKLSNNELFFENKFYECGKKFVKSKYTQVTLNSVPLYIIETFVMMSFFISIAVMIGRGISFDKILPFLTVLAMAAIRLLPAMSRISGCYAGLVFGEPALDSLINQFRLKNEADYNVKKISSIPLLFNDKISYRNVSYRYPQGVKDVFTKINFQIPKGSSVGIIGSSGAGKTTVVDILLGLLKPSEGNVFIDDLCMDENIDAWRKKIGYIPQSIFLLDGTIKENIAFGIDEKYIDNNKIDNALKSAAIYDFVYDLPEGINTEIGEHGVRLSGGQKQRLAIARAMYRNPSILVFDEATSALDVETEKIVMATVKELHGEKTIVIIAHRLSTIEDCDIVYKISNNSVFVEKNVFKDK